MTRERRYQRLILAFTFLECCGHKQGLDLKRTAQFPLICRRSWMSPRWLLICEIGLPNNRQQLIPTQHSKLNSFQVDIQISLALLSLRAGSYA